MLQNTYVDIGAPSGLLRNNQVFAMSTDKRDNTRTNRVASYLVNRQRNNKTSSNTRSCLSNPNYDQLIHATND